VRSSFPWHGVSRCLAVAGTAIAVALPPSVGSAVAANAAVPPTLSSTQRAETPDLDEPALDLPGLGSEDGVQPGIEDPAGDDPAGPGGSTDEQPDDATNEPRDTVDLPRPPRDAVGPERPSPPSRPPAPTPDEPGPGAPKDVDADKDGTGETDDGDTVDVPTEPPIDSQTVSPIDLAALSEVSRQFSAAMRQLASARADLVAARVAATRAIAAQRKARRAFERASQRLEDARASEKKAERHMARLERDLVKARELVGDMARQAYRSGGSLASIGVLLQATTPADFARRYAEVRSVVRAGDDALAEISGRLAGAAEAEQYYEGVRELRRDLEQQAAARLQERRTSARLARLAARERASAVQRQTEAIQVLQGARGDELARYRAYTRATGAVGEALVDLSGQLTGSGVPGTGRFVLPGFGDITSVFGPRFHPILRYTRMHSGIDLGVGDGYTYAADRGVVTIAGYNGGYGNVLVIDHGEVDGRRVTTLYGHHSALLVDAGDVVRKGDPIGLVGSTGYSTGLHLHFEVRIDGVPQDPMPYLARARAPR
jgi:murein DD-endopeptidase MepM/ murein hydrolase activator NlpD